MPRKDSRHFRSRHQLIKSNSKPHMGFSQLTSKLSPQHCICCALINAKHTSLNCHNWPVSVVKIGSSNYRIHSDACIHILNARPILADLTQVNSLYPVKSPITQQSPTENGEMRFRSPPTKSPRNMGTYAYKPILLNVDN